MFAVGIGEEVVTEKPDLPLSSTAELSLEKILTAFKNGKMLEVKSIFYQILSLLDETEENKESPSLLTPALNYMNNHINNPYIEINHLADLCGVSVDYFRHNFHKHFGISPKKYR